MGNAGRPDGPDEAISGTVVRRPLTNAERQRRFKARRRQQRQELAAQSGQQAAPVAAREPTGPGAYGPGNVSALKSGIYSERKLAPLAEEILTSAQEDPAWPPYLADATYGPALRAWARAEAAVELFSAYVSEQLPEDWISETAVTEEETAGDGERGGSSERKATTRKVGGSLEQWRKIEAHAAALRQKLGLDPLSRARLGRDLTSSRLDMAQVMAQLAAEESAAKQ